MHSKICFRQLPFSSTTTVLSQLTLKRGLVARDEQLNNVSYQSIDIESSRHQDRGFGSTQYSSTLSLAMIRRYIVLEFNNHILESISLHYCT